jgi:hypothetical protein
VPGTSATSLTPPAVATRRRTAVVARTQSAYYLATGLFPFVTRRGFEAVTGPKPEWWLVITVGALTSVVGASLGGAALNDRVTPETAALAVGTAASLGVIDVVYSARRRISPVYLLDAVAQAALLGGWLAARRGALER